MKEEQFISRLRANLSDLAGGIQLREGDGIAILRKLTNNQLLRNELCARYPLGKELGLRLAPVKKLFGESLPGVQLAGKVVLRYDLLVADGGYDEPMGQGDLHTLLKEREQSLGMANEALILGLYSPTGWNQGARDYVVNDPPGSGWPGGRVLPILIGPDITSLVWDRKQELILRHVPIFSGLTRQEREAACRDAMVHELRVREFAGLEQLALEHYWESGLVEKVARKLAEEDHRLTVVKIKEVGMVIKRRVEG